MRFEILGRIVSRGGTGDSARGFNGAIAAVRALAASHSYKLSRGMTNHSINETDDGQSCREEAWHITCVCVAYVYGCGWHVSIYQPTNEKTITLFGKRTGVLHGPTQGT